MKIGSSQRHDEVSQSDEGRVRIGEQADDHVTVEHRHRGLVAIQYAVFEISGWAPVEHARRVVFHLRLLEVEVLGLVVGDADLQTTVVVDVGAAGRAVRWPAIAPGPTKDKRTLLLCFEQIFFTHCHTSFVQTQGCTTYGHFEIH